MLKIKNVMVYSGKIVKLKSGGALMIDTRLIIFS